MSSILRFYILLYIILFQSAMPNREKLINDQCHVVAYKFGPMSGEAHLLLFYLTALNLKLSDLLIILPLPPLGPLSLCRKVALLSLFYRYYFGHCSVELAGCVPAPLVRPRGTRQASHSHKYCVNLINKRISRFSDLCPLELPSLLYFS